MSDTSASIATTIHEFIPDTTPRRVLLFNPPVYDTRFPWNQWQQPTALLQLATLFQRHHCDVRLVDALDRRANEDLRRRRMRILRRSETTINYWRFGMLPGVMMGKFVALKKERWEPEEVYIHGFVTYWWEGVQEAVGVVRRYFPKARIIVFGAYATWATDHAVSHSGADVVVNGSIAGLAGLPADLSLYSSSPSFSYISIGTNERSAEDVLDELAAKTVPAPKGDAVTQFAFADHDVAGQFSLQFRAVLQGVIDRGLRVKFYALGNVYPRDFAHDPELALLMRRAGFKQIVFADDRDISPDSADRARFRDEIVAAVEACQAAGYTPGTEALAASVCVGRLEERLEDVVSFMAEVAHIARSLIIVPYQPVPIECPSEISLELQNGKVFPFAEQNGLSYREYQDVVGLAAMLNAKYRSRTFDFRGDGLIATLVRSSLANQSWDPQSTDSLIPQKPIVIGYFNREGKWVRS